MNCTDYIYSNEYVDFTVDYRYDEQTIYDRFNPDCIMQITRKYYNVYKKIENVMELPIIEYGYSTFQKIYGLLYFE